MDNLQIEVKRHKLQQQFLEQIEFGNHSQQDISRASGEMPIIKTNVGGMNPNPQGSPVGNYSPQTKPPITVGANRLGARDKTEDTTLELKDTKE